MHELISVSLEIGDKVLLFGKIGTVAVVSGAYGIYFKDGVPWELIVKFQKL